MNAMTENLVNSEVAESREISREKLNRHLNEKKFNEEFKDFNTQRSLSSQESGMMSIIYICC